MKKEERIYVAGHRGLAGSAILRRLQKEGFANIVVRSHAELDLASAPDVERFFVREKPRHVFLAAAKVGGIMANNTYPADFIRENLSIALNVIDAAYRHGVSRLLFLGSSCIYPREAPQPMREECLLTGPLEPTNSPYAVAKIAGIEMCRSYNRQHGTRFLGVMPTNLYGIADNYDLQNSHVLPALIRKVHEAKVRKAARVTVWGTGTPRREFLLADDLADACLFLMRLPDDRFHPLLTQQGAPALVNIGSGVDVTIRELAETIKRVVGFDGELSFDTSKPDGPARKLLDVSRLHALGWRHATELKDGIPVAYADFMARHPAE
jgi:GDP-L-fucose synthase